MVIGVHTGSRGFSANYPSPQIMYTLTQIPSKLITLYRIMRKILTCVTYWIRLKLLCTTCVQYALVRIQYINIFDLKHAIHFIAVL